LKKGRIYATQKKRGNGQQKGKLVMKNQNGEFYLEKNDDKGKGENSGTLSRKTHKRKTQGRWPA